MIDLLSPRVWGLLLAGSLAVGTARAQLPGYSVVASPWMGAEAAAPGTVRLHALAYLRNTEYFNPIEEGQTWFGTQLAVQRAWTVSPKVTFRAGAWMNHTYGGTTRLLPLVQMRYETAPTSSSAPGGSGWRAHWTVRPVTVCWNRFTTLPVRWRILWSTVCNPPNEAVDGVRISGFLGRRPSFMQSLRSNVFGPEPPNS